MNQVVDEELLTRFVEGDSTAFKQLYDRHKGGLYRYMMRQLNDQQLAEDLFQDTWGKVIAKAETFEADAKFTTWLYKMARNRVIDHVRHLRVVDTVIDNSSDAPELHPEQSDVLQNTPEVVAQSYKQRIYLNECMQSLPVKLLEVFLLKEESTMTIKQIANVIDTSHEATKSRLRYAYGQLKECLSKKMPDWASAGTYHD